MFKWFFCTQIIPRFISSLWCIFVKLLLWRKIKQVLIMRPHIFSFSWLCFKIEEIKCIRIPLVSQNNNKKSLWSRHCHFHLNADTDVGTGRHSSSLQRNVRRGMFRCRYLCHILPLAPAAMVAISGYYVCCCCGAGEEMLMEFQMMLKSRARDWSDECIPAWEQPSLYCNILWKCNV